VTQPRRLAGQLGVGKLCFQLVQIARVGLGRDSILLRGPRAKIDVLAALAAKWAKGVQGFVERGGCAAGGAGHEWRFARGFAQGLALRLTHGGDEAL
jgi:hypothetical protein